MSGCFGNTRYDRWLESQINQYYQQCDNEEYWSEKEDEEDLETE